MSNKQIRPLVAGNWKMNGNKALLKVFSESLEVPDNIDVVLCLPSPYLSAVSDAKFALGAQNSSEFLAGAHTGEVSVSMLKDLECRYVITGHSERRENHAEDNHCIGRKTKTILDAGLTPIICVGEPLEIRESGQVFDFVKAQLDAVMSECGADFVARSVVAYEPIWAIGTGKTASPAQAQEVHEFIRKHLAQWDEAAAGAVRILYGGSVNAENAKELFAKKDIDGGLIGGASLKIDDFNTICHAAS